MLSILIPVYNTVVGGLVEDLHRQCLDTGVDFEILCYDDASEEKYKKANAKLKGLAKVRYVELEKNIGRAAIRNLLAAEAQYRYLLFIDADSRVINEDYIKRYVSMLSPGCVIYGGRQYQEEMPADRNKILHWKYGKKKESLPVSKRIRKPYLNFMSNNFVIDREILKKVPFDMEHSGYGYEDTLFAFMLKKNGYAVTHVANPLVHTGLEDTAVFLSKTIEAMRNLAGLYAEGKIKTTRLIDIYRLMDKNFVLPLILNFVRKNKGSLFENFFSDNPNVTSLQVYKMYVFDKFYKKLKKASTKE